MTAPISSDALEPILERVLAHARKFGATESDAVATHGRSLSIAVRGGALEDVDQSEGRDIGLRVFVGARQACVSSSDISEGSLEKLAERAVAMARLAPEDPFCGLAQDKRLETKPKDLDVFDDTVLTPQDLFTRAETVEKTAADVKGVMQAEGASSSWATSAIHFKTSAGFSQGWRSSRHSLSVSAIAEQDGDMERDYDHAGTRWLEDLRSPEDIGRSAGMRAVARLGSRQLPSGALPVIFEQRISGALVSGMLGAISGPSVARGVSYLKNHMGEAVLASNLNIIDDPHMLRGHGSRPWDGEGVKTTKQHIVKDGVLQTWLLNTASAKQLKLRTTGHANRSIGSPPGVAATNTYLENGLITPDALTAETGEGLLITEMFGPSLNSHTGDYSVGVAGFKIENGERAYPVSEITIAGNLREMFLTLTPANDLVFDGATVAPTLRAEGLTIAGT